jgi:transposase
VFVQDHLSPEKLKKIERPQTDAALAKRFQIIVLANKGWTAPEVAMAVGLSRRMCQLWIQRYNEHGVDGLHNLEGRGRRPPLTPEQEEQVRHRIENGPLPEGKVCSLSRADVKNILENKFEVCRSLSAVYDLLHRLGYSCLQPRPERYRSGPKLQEAFKRELPGRLSEAAKAHPGNRIRVYRQDEPRFSQQGAITRVWARKVRGRGWFGKRSMNICGSSV